MLMFTIATNQMQEFRHVPHFEINVNTTGHYWNY